MELVSYKTGLDFQVPNHSKPCRDGLEGHPFTNHAPTSINNRPQKHCCNQFLLIKHRDQQPSPVRQTMAKQLPNAAKDAISTPRNQSCCQHVPNLLGKVLGLLGVANISRMPW